MIDVLKNIIHKKKKIHNSNNYSRKFCLIITEIIAYVCVKKENKNCTSLCMPVCTFECCLINIIQPRLSTLPIYNHLDEGRLSWECCFWDSMHTNTLVTLQTLSRDKGKKNIVPYLNLIDLKKKNFPQKSKAVSLSSKNRLLTYLNKRNPESHLTVKIFHEN